LKTRLIRHSVATAVLGLLAAAASGREVRSVPSSEVDALFAPWTNVTPGCAVGVSAGGRIVLEKAYGMADLEHEVPNAPDTIFEAGSVSKQFTAMAVLLLAKDGKLSLDDPVRRYIPELPENSAAITIRQMLQHTSGLRDWGSVEDTAGWPRGTRVYTHAHVLDIAGRQSRLNFSPGTRWSYSNTGYNLAAILVSRIGGEPFAEFTRKRIFEPLGMTRTSWRDDFTRVVKGRAIAYAASDAGYKTDMPFENVHGNGGLLTSVGDLLRWNRNFTEAHVGDAALLREAQTPGRLSSGQEHGYAFGLSVDRYKGLREIRHSGTTASYRAYLSRFPDEVVSVALLCNAGDSMPRKTLHDVADLYLADVLKPEPDPPAVEVVDAQLDALAGLYRNAERGDVIRIERDEKGLKFGDGMALVALSRARFTDRDGTFIEFGGRDAATLDDGSGTLIRLEKMAQARPAAAELEALAGTYTSDDAEVTLRAQLRDGALEILRRPDGVFPLTPLYTDAFDSELGTIIFRRDAAGSPVEFSVVQDRVWDLRFQRQ
jgi:CubicO group peptidase (beta-lactamase class C family)